MARIRLNNEYRTKIANRMRVHLEQEDTQEKKKYDEMKAEQISLNDNAWKIAETIVTLPMYPGLSKEQLDYMIASINEVLKYVKQEK